MSVLPTEKRSLRSDGTPLFHWRPGSITNINAVLSEYRHQDSDIPLGLGRTAWEPQQKCCCAGSRL